MPDTVNVLQQRIDVLGSRKAALRAELQAQLEMELSRRLQPIDAAIAELRYVLGIMQNTAGAVQPVYDLAKPVRQAVAQVASAAAIAAEKKQVLSPKTGTPVLSSADQLKQKLGRS